MKIEARDIFEQIGNAFYAVAVDQNGNDLKRTQLQNLIAKDWLPRNASTDGVVSNEAQCMLIAMDENENEHLSAKESFNEFSRFYRLHQDVFSPDLLQRILNTAREIASTFSGGGSNKNLILKSLEELLNK